MYSFFLEIFIALTVFLALGDTQKFGCGMQWKDVFATQLANCVLWNPEVYFREDILDTKREQGDQLCKGPIRTVPQE